MEPIQCICESHTIRKKTEDAVGLNFELPNSRLGSAAVYVHSMWNVREILSRNKTYNFVQSRLV